MGFDDGSVILDSANGAYYAGQTIYGRIVFDQGKPKTIHGIYVSCKGYCKVHWTTHKTRRVNDRTVTKTINHNSYEEYFKKKTFIVGSSDGEHHLQQGHHEFRFDCPIPNNCPSSFEGSHGHIRYQVKVVMVTSGIFSSNKEKIVSIRVHAPLDLNQNPNCREPIESVIVSTYCCWCVSSGSSEVRVKLPVSGYCAGQVIPMEVSVQNTSSVEIDELIFGIKKIVKFEAMHAPGTKHDSDTICEMKKGPIPGGTTRNWTLEMEVPAMDIYNVNACRFIDITYYFEVNCSVGACHEDGEDSHIIFFGTVPLVGFQDQVENPLRDQLPKPIEVQNSQNANTYPPPPITHQPMHSPHPNGNYPQNTPYPSPYPTPNIPPYPQPGPPNVSPYPNASPHPQPNPGYPNNTPYPPGPQSTPLPPVYPGHSPSPYPPGPIGTPNPSQPYLSVNPGHNSTPSSAPGYLGPPSHSPYPPGNIGTPNSAPGFPGSSPVPPYPPNPSRPYLGVNPGHNSTPSSAPGHLGPPSHSPYPPGNIGTPNSAPGFPGSSPVPPYPPNPSRPYLGVNPGHNSTPSSAPGHLGLPSHSPYPPGNIGTPNSAPGFPGSSPVPPNPSNPSQPYLGVNPGHNSTPSSAPGYLGPPGHSPYLPRNIGTPNSAPGFPGSSPVPPYPGSNAGNIGFVAASGDPATVPLLPPDNNAPYPIVSSPYQKASAPEPSTPGDETKPIEMHSISPAYNPDFPKNDHKEEK